jgi:hypothetical protein
MDEEIDSSETKKARYPTRTNLPSNPRENSSETPSSWPCRIGQEWSPPYTKENLSTLCEFGNGQKLNIGGRFIVFRHGYSSEDEKRNRIGQRVSMTQQEEDEWNGNWGKHLIFNAIKVENG